MTVVNIHEAKTQLSKIVDAVAAGAEVVIAKAGKPMVRVVPLEYGRKPVHFGLLRGEVRIADDFDATLPDDVIEAFESPQ